MGNFIVCLIAFFLGMTIGMEVISTLEDYAAYTIIQNYGVVKSIEINNSNEYHVKVKTQKEENKDVTLIIYTDTLYSIGDTIRFK